MSLLECFQVRQLERKEEMRAQHGHVEQPSMGAPQPTLGREGTSWTHTAARILTAQNFESR